MLNNRFFVFILVNTNFTLLLGKSNQKGIFLMFQELFHFIKKI